MILRLRVFTCLLGSSVCSSLAAQELRAQGLLDPVKAEVRVPQLLPTSTDVELKPTGPDSWTYKILKPEERVVGTAKFAFDQSPATYSYLPVRIRVPYRTDVPLRASLVGILPRDTNARVYELWATTVTSSPNAAVRLPLLFSLYQETTVMAARRLRQIREGGIFFAIDAKLFYKYLEVSRELGHRANLVLDDGVFEVQQLLREQLETERGKEILNRLPGVRTLLTQIDLVDAEQMRRVWLTISTKEPPFTQETCALHRAFLRNLGGDFYDAPMKMWPEHTNYGLVQLAADAVNVCTTKLAEGGRKPGAIEAARITEQLVEEVASKSSSRDFTATMHSIRESLGRVPK